MRSVTLSLRLTCICFYERKHLKKMEIKGFPSCLEWGFAPPKDKIFEEDGLVEAMLEVNL